MIQIFLILLIFQFFSTVLFKIIVLTKIINDFYIVQVFSVIKWLKGQPSCPQPNPISEFILSNLITHNTEKKNR